MMPSAPSKKPSESLLKLVADDSPDLNIWTATIIVLSEHLNDLEERTIRNERILAELDKAIEDNKRNFHDLRELYKERLARLEGKS